MNTAESQNIAYQDYIHETTRLKCGMQANHLKAAFESSDEAVLKGIADGRAFLEKMSEDHPRRAAANGAIMALEILAKMRAIA